MALLRQRMAQHIATREEVREAIAALREVRSGAAVAARTNSRAVKMGVAPKASAAEYLKGLGPKVVK
jgi:hypothetical protein